jgi:hypothetical protein
MRIATLTSLIFALGLGSLAQQRTHWTQAENFGLEGPIHSQWSVTTKLAVDPRHDPKLLIIPTQPWMVFDTNGNLVESGTVDNSGNFTNVQKMTVDQSGRVLDSVLTDGTHAIHWRNEYVMGSNGPIELRSYQEGQLSTRMVKSYDGQGREAESTVYDGDGRLISRSNSLSDSDGRQVRFRVSTGEGKLLQDIQDQSDAEGNPFSRTWFDENGRETMNITLRKDGSLSSWWREPSCKCSGNFGLNFANDVTKEYAVGENGEMEITLEQHPDRYGNIENDQVERLSEDGRSLEKVTLRYERDRFGNWTKRVTSAWDPALGIMVEIQQDRRELTYY